MGMTSTNNFASCVNWPNVFVQHSHSKGLLKACLIKFQAAEDIINSSFSGSDLCPGYLQAICKNIYKHHNKGLL